MSRLSIVLPAYNEELMVGKTCKVLKEELEKAGIAYELVLVDDGSKDHTWEVLRMQMWWVFIFQGTLEKRRLSVQGLHRQKGM